MRPKLSRARLAATVAAVAVPAAVLALSPTASAGAAPAHTQGTARAHTNSTIVRTYVYRDYYDAVRIQEIHACANFTYDAIINGRYHALEYHGWISTDTAGSGWC